ncbi:MAG: FAD-dependent oxidoreductase [Terriglobia bacterium]
MQSIAIIGGGPAGTAAAERLLKGAQESGQRIPEVLLFEERPGWEKPCGGGLTAKAVRRYPFLMDACQPHTQVEEAELVAANGAAVRMRLRAPLLVYSRSVLNGLLLKRAQNAGARIIEDRILGFEREGPGERGWRLRGRTGAYFADYLILAAGARSGLRKLLAPPVEAQDYMLTFGYFAPPAGRLLRVQFFEDFEGYAWAFPRPDHMALGIAGQMGESNMPGLRSRLHGFIERFGYPVKQSPVFGHLLPALGEASWQKLTLAGDGWAMVGDVGGLVDPLTGEGIYFAMRSGELSAEAILRGQPEEYPEKVWHEFGRRHESGARHATLFYHSDFWGKPVTTRMVEFCSGSGSFMNLLQDLFEGTQVYTGLPKRVYHLLARGMIEMAAGSAKSAMSGFFKAL